MLRVLRREKPARPVLFELFLERHLVEAVTGQSWETLDDPGIRKAHISAAAALGYDYASIRASNFGFPTRSDQHGMKTRSLNEGAVVTDWESFERYGWQDPEERYQGCLEALAPFLPGGMKFIVMGPGGVLENAIGLTGFDNLCYLLADDPALAEAIFNRVGEGIVAYYRQIAGCDSVGALISNDDWGFKTQTMLSPADMRRYVFPWHRRIVETGHAAGKPVILHSCGNLESVMEDVIEMGYDGKHSYEDAIQPVERFYDAYRGRLAVIGASTGLPLPRPARSGVPAQPRDAYENRRGGVRAGVGEQHSQLCAPRELFRDGGGGGDDGLNR
jgi:uroporphyrinogen decarboxylase